MGRSESGFKESYNGLALGNINPQATYAPTTYDLAAERALLGALLVSDEARSELLGSLSEKVFYSERHRVVFAEIARTETEGGVVDPVILAGSLKDHPSASSLAPDELVFELIDGVPTALHAAHYADTVKNRYLLRHGIDVTSRAQQRLLENPTDPKAALGEAERMLAGASEGFGGGGLRRASEVSRDSLAEAQRIYESGGDVPGISTGYTDYDEKFGKIRNGDFEILAARPAMGKTAMGLDIAWHVAGVLGRGVACFSLEMSDAQLIQRLVSRRSGIPLTKIRNADISEALWPSFVKAHAKVASAPLAIDHDPQKTVLDMKGEARRMAAAFKREGTPLGLILVDYVQLMVSSGKEDNRQQEVAAISRALKVMARELDVPVIGIAQLSRAVEQRHDKRPVLSDLRDSGAIEQDADKVNFIYRDHYYNEDSEHRSEAELIVRKNRNGPTGKATLAWIEREAGFGNLAKAYTGA